MELVTDCAEIPSNSNDYFSSVADKILEKNKTPTLKTFDTYLGDSNPHSFVSDPSAPNEVFLMISGLNQNKGTGPNGIATELLKMLNLPLVHP